MCGWRHEEKCVAAFLLAGAVAEGPSHGDVEWDMWWEGRHWNLNVDRHRHWHLDRHGHGHLDYDRAVHWHWHMDGHRHGSVNHNNAFQGH